MRNAGGFSRTNVILTTDDGLEMYRQEGGVQRV